MSWDPVYRLVKTIPRGHVTTYGLLARALKTRGGARTVGHAMAATPSGQGIPWHRVVAAGGKLIIREPYGAKQRKLLETEGVPIHNGRIDFSTYGWTPPAAGGNPARSQRRGREPNPILLIGNRASAMTTIALHVSPQKSRRPKSPVQCRV